MRNAMRKITMMVLILILTACTGYAANGNGSALKLTPEEAVWLKNNKDRVFVLGIDPYSGMDYYKYNGMEKGYVLDLIKAIEEDLGIDIRLEASKSWGEVLDGLKTGKVDILYGANETPERKAYMEFTRPIYKYPYAVIAAKNDSIHTIGDIDGKTVGFIEGDMVIDALPQVYKDIKYKARIYYSQEEGIAALIDKEIDGFITSGGAIVFEFIYRFPELKQISEISNITSDMTLSTRKEDKMLAGILDKEIEHLSGSVIPRLIEQAQVDYYRKIMNLTPEELRWLEEDGEAIVGVPDDYLPFDYFEDGQYKGISGQVINGISRITGIRFINKQGEFDTLLEALKRGGIDLLNIAKTEERQQYFLYPQPYSTERDIIVGRRSSTDAVDVYGLEGKRVAVVKGYWHYEYLMKNLVNVSIIETKNVQESMKLIHEGKADYMIENPSVVRYYVEELQYYDLVEKGVTSADSFLYYGVAKTQPKLAGIIDKAIPLLDMEVLIRKGYEEVPHSSKESYTTLVMALIGAIVLLFAVTLYVMKLFRDLVRERTESELLRQREQFLYTDALTGVHNRNYYKRKIRDTINEEPYPQTVIICDMNNLKPINDAYGHHIGDELLKSLSEALQEACPEGSLIVRLGGDEFIIILTGSGEDTARETVERIRRLKALKPVMTDCGQKVYPEAAFGYAVRYSDETHLDELIKAADRRMYQDKREGKNPSDE